MHKIKYYGQRIYGNRRRQNPARARYIKYKPAPKKIPGFRKF